MPENITTDLAVAIGRIEQDVKHIRGDTEKSSINLTQYQLSVNSEFDKVHERLNGHGSRITKIETSLKTNLTWVTIILSVVTVVVNIASKFI